MGPTALLVVFLLLSLVEVRSQTAPYISFMGETLPNHAHVNLSLVGNNANGSDSVQCRTDLFSCCTQQGTGEWYHPDMSIVALSDDMYAVHGAKQIDLRRRRSNAMSGIYRCDIETIAVHGDYPSTKESIYVGLYTSGGMSRFAHIHYM